LRRVLLVGSVGLPEREQVFRTLARHIGGCTPRFTDGEVPPRNRWMMWQRDVFERSPDFELDSSAEVFFGGERRVFDRFRLKPGADVDALRLGELGYAREAIKSYEVFRRLREQGVVPPGVRFQMSLPSMVAVCTQHIAKADQARVERAYEQALGAEIARMLETIPATELAIQWDICQEVLAIEGAWSVYYADPLAGAIQRMVRLSALVPEPCELGFHLCYGDPGHKHIKEPGDLGVCVQLANGVCAGASRPVNWIHMPVPRERRDTDYVAPLKNLKLMPGTELYLGLLHLTDGVAGARARIEAATAFRNDFGIATECGFGRRPPQTIPALLELHAEVARW
jgi:hypothetical protein